VTCKRCPAFSVCPLKGVIGDYKKPEETPKDPDETQRVVRKEK
jgi:hypothetical protein